MSKWKILQDAICQKRRTIDNQASIHRFIGHSSFQKNRCFWKGFHYSFSMKEVSSAIITEHDEEEQLLLRQFQQFCYSYIQKIDCPEMFLDIQILNDQEAQEVTELIRLVTNNKSEGTLSPLQIELLEPLDFSSLLTNGAMTIVTLKINQTDYIPFEKSFKLYRYRLSPFHDKAEIFTREPLENKTITATDLLSDRLFGVDNTGNICVWPSEPLLLYILLENPSLRQLLQSRSILEIGGGLTGLVGLGLAILGVSKKVLITDGHPSCVRNQEVCIEMCKCAGAFKNQEVAISAKLLNWSCFDVNEIGLWEVIIGSDCLFFEDFHESLLILLRALFTQDGIALFFQPRRSKSMENFIDKANSSFAVEVIENYSSKISNERDRYILSNDSSYSADIHYPILLIVRRKSS